MILWWALQDSNLRLPPCQGVRKSVNNRRHSTYQLVESAKTAQLALFAAKMLPNLPERANGLIVWDQPDNLPAFSATCPPMICPTFWSAWGFEFKARWSMKILCGASSWRTASDGWMCVGITPYTPKPRHIYDAIIYFMARSACNWRDSMF